jgi:hypothetical protein
MAGFSNETVYGKNVNFTGTTKTPTVTSDGQLLIGSTTLPNIRVNTLTAGSGINITNGNGTITIATNGMGDLHTARYIVSAGGAADGANYTTIASAITAAVAAGGNQTIFIQPGTYTENLTLSANINLAAYNCDATTPNVTISGTLTASFAGTASISGIRLQTNSANVLSITGSSATIINLVNCFINATNNTAISVSSTSTSVRINMFACQGDLTTTGIAYFAVQRGILAIRNCNFGNSGGSTTASTLSNEASLIIKDSLFSNIFTTSNTSAVSCVNTDFFGSGTATFTFNGTGTNNIDFCRIESGTNSAISIGAGAGLTANHISINSSNANAITGAGTLTYSDVIFYGSSNTVNTTTQTGNYVDLGKYKARSQPAFLAYLASTASNKTGAGTAYTLGTDALTEVFDQGGDFNTNGTFTAPVTGKYDLGSGVNMSGVTAAMTVGLFEIVTSNRIYSNVPFGPGKVFDNNTAIAYFLSALADMDAADTATFRVTLFNGAGNDVDITGTAGATTYVYGKLAC